MKRFYHILCPITAAQGHQLYQVEAESADEAIAISRCGGGEFLSEEIEVTDLGEPECLGIAE